MNTIFSLLNIYKLSLDTRAYPCQIPISQMILDWNSKKNTRVDSIAGQVKLVKTVFSTVLELESRFGI